MQIFKRTSLPRALREFGQNILYFSYEDVFLWQCFFLIDFLIVTISLKLFDRQWKLQIIATATEVLEFSIIIEPAAN